MYKYILKEVKFSMVEMIGSLGILMVSVVGLFSSASLLLTTNHKKSSLPFFSVMAYVMFMIVYLFIGCITFLKLCTGKLFLMEILASICFIASIAISYKIKKDGNGDKLKNITQKIFWCCIVVLCIMCRIKF